MILNEVNKSYYNKSISSIYLDDSVLLAKLIVNYFLEKGFYTEYTTRFGKDLAKKDGSFKKENWLYDWHNLGVNFSFYKDLKLDEFAGYVRVGFDEGSAIIQIRKENSSIKYKKSLNTTIQDFVEFLFEKFSSEEQGEKDYSIEKSFESTALNLFKSKGITASFDDTRNTFYVRTKDFEDVISPGTFKLLKIIGDSDWPPSLVDQDHINTFIKVVRYIVKRYSQIGYRIMTRECNIYRETKSVRLEFQKSNSKGIQEGIDEIETYLERLSNGEKGDKGFEDILDTRVKQVLIDFFRESYYFDRVVSALKHI